MLAQIPDQVIDFYAELFDQLFYRPFVDEIDSRRKQREVERQVGGVADAAAPSLSRFLLNQELSLELAASMLDGLACLGDVLKLEDVSNPNVSPEEKADTVLADVPCPKDVENANHDAAYRIALHAVIQTLMLVGPVISEWRKVRFAKTFELPRRVTRLLNEIDEQLKNLSEFGESGADERFELDYRDYLAQRFHRVEAGTVRMTTNLAVDLRELFVMPSVRERQEPEAGEEQEPIDLMNLAAARQWFEERQQRESEDPDKKREIRSALDQVLHQRRNVIIGTPGSGKSTFLEWLQLEIAMVYEEMPLGGAQAIPLLLRVRQLNLDNLPQGSQMIEKATASQDRSALMPRGWLERKMKAGRVLLMLDGLDEVDPESRDQKLLPWLVDFCERYPDCAFLVTSRPVGYPPGVLRGLNFVECDLMEFNSNQVDEYTRHWCTAVRLAQNEPEEEARREGGFDGQQISKSFRQHTYIRDLASNPLMLSAVCLVNYFEGGRLPDDRALLYRLCVEGLLHNWDQRRGIRSEFGLDEKLRVCREVALAMQIDNRAEASVDEVAQVFLNTLNDEERATRLLEHVRFRSGLLLERRSNVYAFTHLTFQEYLAAYSIHEGNAFRVTSEILVKQHSDDKWQEVIPLYCGLAPLPAARNLLEGLISEQNTLRLGRVLSSAYITAGEYMGLDEILRHRVIERIALAPSQDLIIYLDKFDASEVAPIANNCVGRTISRPISGAYLWLGFNIDKIDRIHLLTRLESDWNHMERDQIGQLMSLIHRAGLRHDDLKFIPSLTAIYRSPGWLYENTTQAEEALRFSLISEASPTVALREIAKVLFESDYRLLDTFWEANVLVGFGKRYRREEPEQKELTSLVERYTDLFLQQEIGGVAAEFASWARILKKDPKEKSNPENASV